MTMQFLLQSTSALTWTLTLAAEIFLSEMYCRSPIIPFGTGPTPAAALHSHASKKAHTNRVLITKGYCIAMGQQHALSAAK